MKKHLFFSLCLICIQTIATDLTVGTEVVENIYTEIEPIKIIGDINTPYAFQFVRKNYFGSTCTLVSKHDLKKSLEIIGPENDNYFPNCSNLYKPLIVKVGKHYFAIYKYITEDPRREFNTDYQLIKLNKHGFSQCKEEDAITKVAKQKIKNKIRFKIAFEDAIKKIGCS